MSRHVLYAGRVVSLGAVDRTSLARVVLDIATGYEHLAASRETAAAIAADGLLFTDVEVALTRAGETTPADGERTRYLAASADVARLERALATAESARDRHHLRARLLADGILDVAAGRPLDARLDGIAPDGDPGVTCACTDRRPKRRGHCTCGGRGGHSLACQFARADELAGYVDAEAA